MLNKPAILALSDGTIFEGIAAGACGDCVGELVFNTAMTGYQEILTDPSYAKQIVMLTMAHVGNTGCNAEDMESSRAWASGLVTRHLTPHPRHYRSQQSLPDWLKEKGVVAIAGIDTRALTLRLREQGAMNACISTEVSQPEKAVEKAKAFGGLEGMDLACKVSRLHPERWDEGQGSWGKGAEPPRFHVVVFDFGVKYNMLRILQDKGCQITLVPAKTQASEALSLKPDGIFLSNGPGDPWACDYAIAATKTFLQEEIPLFGICLGFQILALASGAKSVKMKFGHHGANHPVGDNSRRVFITSQNHGFSIEENSLPDCFQITHRSLFDNSLQGIRHQSKPAFGFQGHPEASPGPHDIDVLFDEFIAMMESKQKSKDLL